MIIEVHPDYPQPRRLDQVVKHLERGDLVAYPTDTVYAVGCATTRKKAVAAIHKLKADKRGLDSRAGGSRPLSIIVPDMSTISEWALLDDRAYRLMKRLTPGPFTFVLRATRKVPRVMLTRQKTIGVRIPDSLIARELSERLGAPLITTSATGEDGELLRTPRDIEQAYGGGIKAVLDAGPIYPEPSSVIDLTDDVPVVLREGKGDVSTLF